MSRFRPFLQTAAVCFIIFFAIPVLAASRMPIFSLVDAVSGETVSSNSFEGKALLITFFATWCPPCIEEIPGFIKAQESFQDKGFSVIGLSVDQGGAKVVSKLVKKMSINYPVLLADSETMQNFGGVYGIPVSFLYNREGTVVKKYTGYISHSILEKDLKKIL